MIDTSHLLRDFVKIITEKAVQAKRDANQTHADFELGQQIAYYDVISVLRQEANAFGIPVDLIGLDGIDEESDVL